MFGEFVMHNGFGLTKNYLCLCPYCDPKIASLRCNVIPQLKECCVILPQNHNILAKNSNLKVSETYAIVFILYRHLLASAMGSKSVVLRKINSGGIQASWGSHAARKARKRETDC